MTRHASLNRVYRVVFNRSKGVWQVVAEIGKSAGKTASPRQKAPGLVKTLIGSLFFFSVTA